MRVCCVTAHQRPALAADDVLGAVKAETTEVADGAERAAIPGVAQAMSRVLNDAYPVSCHDLEYGRHLACTPRVVHDHDRPRARRDPGCDLDRIDIHRNGI